MGLKQQVDPDGDRYVVITDTRSYDPVPVRVVRERDLALVLVNWPSPREHELQVRPLATATVMIPPSTEITAEVAAAVQADVERRDG